jgi:ATP/maltotriose-dependent transcriptional regulator MalT
VDRVGRRQSLRPRSRLGRRTLAGERVAAALERGSRPTLEAAYDSPLKASAARPSERMLTERELEVLGLVAEGVTNAEIANALVVSVRTLHAHLRSVYRKLGVRTRTAAVRRGAELGLVRPHTQD